MAQMYDERGNPIDYMPSGVGGQSSVGADSRPALRQGSAIITMPRGGANRDLVLEYAQWPLPYNGEPFVDVLKFDARRVGGTEIYSVGSGPIGKTRSVVEITGEFVTASGVCVSGRYFPSGWIWAETRRIDSDRDRVKTPEMAALGELIRTLPIPSFGLDQKREPKLQEREPEPEVSISERPRRKFKLGDEK